MVTARLPTTNQQPQKGLYHQDQPLMVPNLFHLRFLQKSTWEMEALKYLVSCTQNL